MGLLIIVTSLQSAMRGIYLHNEVEVGGEGLHSVETGDEEDGQEALLVHLPPKKEVPLQVVQAEVVLAA